MTLGAGSINATTTPARRPKLFLFITHATPTSAANVIGLRRVNRVRGSMTYSQEGGRGAIAPAKLPSFPQTDSFDFFDFICD